jgi:hypothetical protein
MMIRQSVPSTNTGAIQGRGYHKWGLAQSFDHIADMVDGWYKTYFKQLMVILYEDLNLPKLPGTITITDADAASSLLRKIVAVRMHDVMHSYVWIRQRANTALNLFPE